MFCYTRLLTVDGQFRRGRIRAQSVAGYAGVLPAVRTVHPFDFQQRFAVVVRDLILSTVVHAHIVLVPLHRRQWIALGLTGQPTRIAFFHRRVRQQFREYRRTDVMLGLAFCYEKQKKKKKNDFSNIVMEFKR